MADSLSFTTIQVDTDGRVSITIRPKGTPLSTWATQEVHVAYMHPCISRALDGFKTTILHPSWQNSNTPNPVIPAVTGRVIVDVDGMRTNDYARFFHGLQEALKKGLWVFDPREGG